MNDREHAAFSAMLMARQAPRPVYSRERWLLGFVRAAAGFGVEQGFPPAQPLNSAFDANWISSTRCCSLGIGT